jgi:hypothetical protein
MNSIKVNEDLDMEFEQDGTVKIATGYESTMNSLEFDIFMNGSWALDKTLGLNWVNDKGTGLLQRKGSALFLIAALRHRILSYKGVKSVENIVVGTNLKREMTFKADVILHSGETFTLQI